MGKVATGQWVFFQPEMLSCNSTGDMTNPGSYPKTNNIFDGPPPGLILHKYKWLTLVAVLLFAAIPLSLSILCNIGILVIL